MFNGNRVKDKKIFRWRWEYLILSCLIIIWPAIAPACPAGSEIEAGINGYSAYLSGRVNTIDNGDLVLDSGQVITLPGIWHPESGPMAARFRQAKRTLIGKSVTLYTTGPAIDRYGRIAGLLRLGDQWLHLRWLCDGVVVRNGSLNMLTLHQAENHARQNKRGLWSDPYFVHRAGDYIDRTVGYFTIIHGKLREVARIRNTIYLNFGDDWKTDTTAAISGDAIDRIQVAHGDLMALTGREIEIRGILQLYNGPYLQIIQPGQLTINPKIKRPD